MTEKDSCKQSFDGAIEMKVPSDLHQVNLEGDDRTVSHGVYTQLRQALLYPEGITEDSILQAKTVLFRCWKTVSKPQLIKDVEMVNQFGPELTHEQKICYLAKQWFERQFENGSEQMGELWWEILQTSFKRDSLYDYIIKPNAKLIAKRIEELLEASPSRPSPEMQSFLRSLVQKFEQFDFKTINAWSNLISTVFVEHQDKAWFTANRESLIDLLARVDQVPLKSLLKSLKEDRFNFLLVDESELRIAYKDLRAMRSLFKQNFSDGSRKDWKQSCKVYATSHLSQALQTPRTNPHR